MQHSRPYPVKAAAAAAFLLPLAAQAAQLSSLQYLEPSFTPVAAASDAAGNLYIAGNSVLDPASGKQAVLVVKLDPKRAAFLYETYINASAGESASGIVVDQAGNAFIAGTTLSPDFPTTQGGQIASPPSGSGDSRPFLVRLSPNGILETSIVFGGPGAAAALQLTSRNTAIVTGMSTANSFPSTPGAYHAQDTTSKPFIVEIDPAKPAIVFAATGVGGSAIALDPSGNIFVAGATTDLSYPTTPGAFQPTIPANFTCVAPTCQLSLPAPSFYVSKLDPTASHLLFSTGINPPGGGNAQLPANLTAPAIALGGLAIDSAGNAYLTGVMPFSNFPYTAPPPHGASVLPFLVKLDPSGSRLIFATPQGGSALALGPLGDLYSAGALLGAAGSTPSLASSIGLPQNFPSQCLPSSLAIAAEGFVQKIDPASGAVLAAQFLEGSMTIPSALAASSYGVFAAGSLGRPDAAFTPSAPLPVTLANRSQPASFAASVSFSPLPAGAPIAACLLDAATLMPVSAIAPGQILSLFGVNLPVSAPGPQVMFGSQPGTVLYSSPSQINVAAPFFDPLQSPSLTIQTASSAVGPGRLLPTAASNPSLFTNLFTTSCSAAGVQFASGPPAVARNQDGSLNSCANPAQPGSVLSVFVNGSGGAVSAQRSATLTGSFSWDVNVAGNSAEVTGNASENQWVMRVSFRIPAAFASTGLPSAIQVPVTLREAGLPVAPLSVSPLLANIPAGDSLPLWIWIEGSLP